MLGTSLVYTVGSEVECASTRFDVERSVGETAGCNHAKEAFLGVPIVGAHSVPIALSVGPRRGRLPKHYG